MTRDLPCAMADVQDFADGFRLPAIIFKVLCQGDGVRGGFAEIRAEIVDAQRGGPEAGHEGIPGR